MAKKQKRIKSFVVDVATWWRGNGSGTSALVVSKGASHEYANNGTTNANVPLTKRPMCCLGHLGRACGVSKKRMLGHGLPSQVSHLTGQFKELMLDTIGNNTPLVMQIARTNDDCAITDSVRKRKLTPLFKKIGLKVRFV